MDYKVELFKWFLSVITLLAMALVGWFISLKTAEKVELNKQKIAVNSLYIDIELLNEKLRAVLTPYCNAYVKLLRWDKGTIIDLRILKYVPWNISKDMGWNSLTKEQKFALTLLNDYLNTAYEGYIKLNRLWESKDENTQIISDMLGHHKSIINLLSASYVLTTRFCNDKDRLIKESYLPTDSEPKKNVKLALDAVGFDVEKDSIKSLVD